MHEPPDSLQRIPADAHHVAADDFPDLVVLVAALDETDGEERPVGPRDGQARLRLRTQAARRPKVAPRRAFARPSRCLGSLGGLVARHIGDIGANALSQPLQGPWSGTATPGHSQSPVFQLFQHRK